MANQSAHSNEHHSHLIAALKEPASVHVFELFMRHHIGRPRIDSSSPDLLGLHPEAPKKGDDLQLVAHYAGTLLVHMALCVGDRNGSVGNNYFVATADLTDRTISRWDVINIENSHSTMGLPVLTQSVFELKERYALNIDARGEVQQSGPSKALMRIFLPTAYHHDQWYRIGAMNGEAKRLHHMQNLEEHLKKG